MLVLQEAPRGPMEDEKNCMGVVAALSGTLILTPIITVRSNEGKLERSSEENFKKDKIQRKPFTRSGRKVPVK